MADCPKCQAVAQTSMQIQERVIASRNLWEARYYEALLELRRINKGAQRLSRKLDNANRRLRRAGRPLEEREAPHCPSCSCGLTEHPTDNYPDK